MEEKELISSSDGFLITQICEILKENNIEFIKKDSGAGSIINVAYGNISSFEKKIIVNSEDYEKAKELIDFLFEENDESEIPDELKEIEEDEEEISEKSKGNYEKKYNLPRKIFGFFIICGILFFIVNLISIVVSMFL